MQYKLISITEFNSTKLKLGHSLKYLNLGSCFADRISAKMRYSKMDVCANPLGIQFNPWSLAKSIDRAIEGKEFHRDEVQRRKSIAYHWDLPASISETDSDRYLEKINSQQQQLSKYLEESSVLVLSFGTSWIYRHNTEDKIVANCHKQDSSLFTKELLDQKELSDQWRVLINKLKNNNPDLKIIMTISPVRHIKNGLIDDRRSKSILNYFVHEICGQFQDIIEYFPAYEIVVDELRDYRYFERDLIHPNSTAVDIVWQKFVEQYFNSEEQSKIEELQKFFTTLNHKPMWPHSEEHALFVESLKKNISTLERKYTYVDFSVEKESLGI